MTADAVIKRYLGLLVIFAAASLYSGHPCGIILLVATLNPSPLAMVLLELF